MFEVGSLLIYDTTGVCKVLEIGVPSGLPATNKNRLYYKLEPVFGPGTIYIPVDTRVFMRPVLTREEAEALIRKIPEICEDICETHNQKVLEDHYKASLMTHNCEDLVQIIKTVYTKKRVLEKNGKKAVKTDQTYMKHAKKLLHEELSIALEIPVEEVEAYITKCLER